MAKIEVQKTDLARKLGFQESKGTKMQATVGKKSSKIGKPAVKIRKNARNKS